MKLLASVVILVLAPVAFAGGAWRLTDSAGKRVVSINGARLYVTPEGGERRERLVFDPAQRVASRSRYYGAEGDVQFEIRKGELLHHGVTVAGSEGGTLRFQAGSGAAYELRLRPTKRKRLGRLVWRVTVRQGEQEIAAGNAIHLITGAKRITRAMQRRDILNRVRLYLAWRELLAGERALAPKRAGGEGGPKDDALALAETARHCWERGLQRNPRFMEGGTLSASWRADAKGRLLHLELKKDPFDFDPGFGRCVLSRTRRYDIQWSPTGNPEVTLEPVEGKGP
jgi:hypothetical protein